MSPTNFPDEAFYYFGSALARIFDFATGQEAGRD
jgi:hypothetical protein